jgi:hydrogenase-1 operon protein HyaE
MTMSLIDRLVESHGYPVVNTGSVDAFLEQSPVSVLFFYGDPKQYPESNDVAVILPELVRKFSGRLAAAVVDSDAQRPLQARFGFTQWPALVFLNRDGYLGTISRVQDWADYLYNIEHIMRATPTRPPLAVTVEGADSTCMGTPGEQGV